MLCKAVLLAMTVVVVFEPSSTTAPSQESPLVAVLDFAVKGEVDKNAGSVAAAQVRDELSASRRFRLLDRRLMAERVKEADLALVLGASHPEPEALTGIGQTLVAEKIVAGEITSVGESWTFEMVLVDVQTGRIEQTYFRQFGGSVEDVSYVASCGARVFAGRAPLPPRRGLRILAVEPLAISTTSSRRTAQQPKEKAVLQGDLPAELKKVVTLMPPYPEMYPGGDTGRMSVQYAVMYLSKEAGLGYDFKRSFANTDPLCRRWISPRVEKQECHEALTSLLSPLGLDYRLNGKTLFLVKRSQVTKEGSPDYRRPGSTGSDATPFTGITDPRGKRVTLVPPYPQPYPGAPSDRISVQYAVSTLARQAGVEYDFRQSQANVGELARRWVQPEVKNMAFSDAVASILAPLGLSYSLSREVLVLEAEAKR